MSIELINPRFDDNDGITAEFQASDRNLAGSITVGLERAEDNYYHSTVSLTRPIETQVRLSSFNRKSGILWLLEIPEKREKLILGLAESAKVRL